MTEPTTEQTEPQPVTEEQPEPQSVTPDRPEPQPTADEQPAPQPDPPAPPRRRTRAALRWTAAVLAFLSVGAGTAYAVVDRTRTDLPGLSTESDGRWRYPEIALPPLPPGAPRPLAGSNTGQNHYADLRALVLPAPEGAVPDPALKGDDGWLATSVFLAQYEKEDRAAFGQSLADNGLRHIAARGWTMPDGTRSRIFLLQFDTHALANRVLSKDVARYSTPYHALIGGHYAELDESFPMNALVEGTARYPYDEVKPYGPEQLRQAYVLAGDVLAVVVQSRSGTAPAVPFQQTVVLQNQLLG
ncbi:hypothetical protein [Streptomyces melanogenes]|uniref:hypothetical protein n=1 Tax=Streptomyces melanogenes TaxID=67326 RepID=UPI00167DC29E|nr:hypothetical protein [Streptomyces melanogenes]GGP34941.1 hypothetical protein GCM10010278_09070 [Streptomyces melanogenes]